MEEALLSGLGKTIVGLWETLQKELNNNSDAEKELEGLIGWRRVIMNLLEEASSVEVTGESYKAGIEMMREFVFDSQSAIDEFPKSAPEGNGILTRVSNRVSNHINLRNFTPKARGAKQKLATGLDNLKMVVDALQSFHQLPGNHARSSSAAYPSSSIAYLEETSKQLVGIEEPRDWLFQCLTGDHLLSKVIFLHGAPGVGKTSLVGAVLGYREMRKHFKFYVWIMDLRSCESTDDIEAALKSADAKIWDLTENNDQGDRVELAEVFRRMEKDDDLRNNRSRWLLVLDDASKVAVFDSLRMPLSETRPSMLVTTRISSLASSSEGSLDFLRAQYDSASPEPSKRPYDFHDLKLAVLSTDDSHELFCRKMPRKYNCATMSKVDFDCILEKCGGLPLAILAMCEHLIHNQRGVDDPQFDEWTTWSGSLQFSSLSNYEENRSVRRMATKYMNHLHNVQSCVSYLSIFPLDCPLRCSTLMRLWMAEGLPDEVSRNLDPRILEETLRNLVDHNFFQEVKKTSYGRFSTCRLNNLQHQIIISESENNNSAMIVANQEKEWPHTIKRLSFHSKINKKVDDMRVGQLFSLHAFKEVHLKSIEKLLGQVKDLKVLDLQRLSTKVEKDCYQDSLRSFPKKILRLTCLTYLSLRDTKIKEIPDEIRHLEDLKTLDLKGTNVSKLCKGILKLKRLRHLLVYRSDKCLAAHPKLKHGVSVEARSVLGVLGSLRKISMIELDPVKRRSRAGKKNRRFLLEEIGKLTELQSLGISMLRSTDVKLLCSSIGNLEILEALRLIAAPEEKIDFSEEDEKKVLKTLKRVHLTGCLVKFSSWILSFTSVVKLVLKGSQLDGGALEKLGKLDSLKHLELQQALDETVVTFQALGFEKLCFLGLDTIDSLQSIEVKEEVLPNLETLSLAQCKSLKTVLPDITRPRKLKCLKLYMPESFMIAVEGNVPAHIKVQPKVWKQGAVENALKPPTNSASGLSLPSEFK